ncbi:MAG: autotransporter-associated beta strand repeat-containing protein, partial [Thermoguttaceae bacterium]
MRKSKPRWSWQSVKRRLGFGQKKNGNRPSHLRRRSASLEPLEARVLLAIWANAPGHANWSDPQAWVGGVVPGSADTAVFPSAATVVTPNLTANASIASLTIDDSQAAYAISQSGGTMTLTVGSGGLSVSHPGSTSAVTTTISPNLSLSASESLTVTNNTGVTTLIVSGVVSGSGSLTASGGGTLVFNGANSYTGGTTLTSGTLEVGTNSALGTGLLILAGGEISSSSTTARTLASNPLAITGSVTIGDATNNGALTFSNATQGISGSPTITVPSGMGAVTLGALALSSSATFTNNSASTLTLGAVAGGGNSLTFKGSGNVAQTGVWSGAGSSVLFDSTYAGIATLNQQNTFTGGTTLNAGTIIISANSNLPTSGPVGTGTLSLNGGTVQGQGGGTGWTITNAVAITGPGTITIADGGNRDPLTFAGVTTVSGNPTLNLNLTSSGYGSFTLSTGGIALNSNLAVTGANPQRLTLGGGFNLNGGTRTITLNDSGAGGVTVSGAFSGTGGTLVLAGTQPVVAMNLTGGTTQALQINGSATYTFSSNSASYSGGTTITAGTILVAGNNSNWPTSGQFGTGTLTLDPAAGLTMETSGGNNTVSNALALTGPGTITLADVTGGNRNFALAGNSTVSGNPVLNFTSLGTSNFNPVVMSGTMTLNSSAAIVNNAGAGPTLSGQITGTGGLTISGSGTTAVSSASNNYSGGTVIDSGTVRFSNFGSLGADGVTFNGGTLQYASSNTADISARTITINAGGATIDTGGNNVTLANPIGNGGAGGFTKVGSGTLTLTAANTYTGDTTISAGALQLGDGTATNGSVAGTIDIIDNGTLVLANPGAQTYAESIIDNGTLVFANSSAQTYAAVIAGSGGLTKEGAGTLTLSGQSTYAGQTDIGGGTLQLGTDNALPAGTVVQVGDPALGCGVFDLAGYNQTLAGLDTGAAGGLHNPLWDAVTNSSSTAVTLTIDNSADYSFAARFDGNLS